MPFQSVIRIDGALGAVLAGATGVAAAVALWLKFRKRVPPAERERRRRMQVYTTGRVCDGNITDVREGMIDYAYSIAGVDYITSQDVTALADLLPPDPTVLIGPAAVKYIPANPANSIVLSERWSGLRFRSPAQMV
jgi:hypothetical protein